MEEKHKYEIGLKLKKLLIKEFSLGQEDIVSSYKNINSITSRNCIIAIIPKTELMKEFIQDFSNVNYNQIIDIKPSSRAGFSKFNLSYVNYALSILKLFDKEHINISSSDDHPIILQNFFVKIIIAPNFREFENE